MKHTLTHLTTLAFSIAAIMAENQPRLTAEGVTVAEGTPNFQMPFSIELIGDPHGERGVKLKSVNPDPAGYNAREEGILRRQDRGSAPIWTLMQAYSEGKHAAQFQLYFTLQNLNRQSPGYGKDYVWFGVPFYDDRHPVIPPGYMMDGTGQEDERKGEKRGTGRFINIDGTKLFAEHGLIPGEWLHINTNILPLMVAALERAWSRGLCNSSTNLADYKIGSMNIGWEVPGLSAVSAQFKDLSLLATGPKARK